MLCEKTDGTKGSQLWGGGGGGGGGGGQHQEGNNLEGRTTFMIVKINILGLMSPKRRLIILRVCEIKTVHRLYCEAKLPYLKKKRMLILPVDEFMFLSVWALDVDV